MIIHQGTKQREGRSSSSSSSSNESREWEMISPRKAGGFLLHMEITLLASLFSSRLSWPMDQVTLVFLSSPSSVPLIMHQDPWNTSKQVPLISSRLVSLPLHLFSHEQMNKENDSSSCCSIIYKVKQNNVNWMISTSSYWSCLISQWNWSLSGNSINFACVYFAIFCFFLSLSLSANRAYTRQ